MVRLHAIFALTLFLGACSVQETSVNDPAEPLPKGSRDVRVGYLLDLVRDHSDEYSLVSATILGDSLILRVKYSGGCTTHDFTLFATPVSIKFMGANIFVHHNANGDPCLGLFTTRQAFDLRGLRVGSHGEILLNFYGPLLPPIIYEY